MYPTMGNVEACDSAVLRGRADSVFCVCEAYVRARNLALPAAQDK